MKQTKPVELQFQRIDEVKRFKIVEEFNKGKLNLKEIADRYNTTESSISYIITKHFEEKVKSIHRGLVLAPMYWGKNEPYYENEWDYGTSFRNYEFDESDPEFYL